MINVIYIIIKNTIIAFCGYLLLKPVIRFLFHMKDD